MRMTGRNKRRSFYVVQFIELPFENIDDYVCVPYTWVVLQKSTNRKVHVTYPKNEDPSETRERVKRKERPNDSWRFYVAFLKHESDFFADANIWIARYEFGLKEEESKEKVTKPEPQPNRKLQSANQSCSTVKHYNNPRKPLPRISLRRPLSQEPAQNLNSKCLKLNENPKPVVITDHTTAASGTSIQERSIIIISNQVIQKGQAKTNYASNGEMNTEQCTQPKVIEENQSVLLAQTTSAELPVGHELSTQPPTEQQLSLQSPTGREPSPQPPIDRHPSPKSITGQNSSSTFSGEQHHSSDYQQPVSISTVMDESIGDVDILRSEPVTDGRPSNKNSPSTFKPAPQPDPMNEGPTPLVRHEHSLPEPHSRFVTAGQSKEPNDCSKTHLHWYLTAPKILPRSPSTSNQLYQQYRHPQLPIFSVNNALNSKIQPLRFGGSNFIEVANNHSFLRSQDIDGMPSTSRQQSPAMKKLKNPVDKKTRLEGITQNIATLQYPPNSMRQLSLPACSTVVQSEQYAQHQQAQIDGSFNNEDRRGIRENFIRQRDPGPQGMMPAAQNLSMLAQQYNPLPGKSHEQQYLPTREDYLQFTRLQDMLRRPTMTSTLDQKIYHQNAMMNGGFIIQTQPNPINQPIQFPPHNGNQYVPINSAYSQEVKSHELMTRYTDGAHVIYKPFTASEVNNQFPTYHLSSRSHQDPEDRQKIQDQRNYRDPRTTNTQNSLQLKSTRSSLIPKPIKATKRSRSLSTSNTPSQALLDAKRSCLIEELDMQERVNNSSMKFNYSNLAAISETQTVKIASSTENTEVQTMPTFNQIQAHHFTMVQNEHNCQRPGIKKNMIDRSTETDSMMGVSHRVEAIAGSSLRENASKAVESMCQTDEWLEKEQDSLYQETSSDSEGATDKEMESENEVVPEANQATLTDEQNPTHEEQHEQSRIIAEQDMLDGIGTLMTQMGANVSFIRDMFDGLRNSLLVCAQTYETLLENVDKFNSIELLQNSASPPNSATSQGTEGRPAADNDNTTSVGNAATSIRERRFTLPASYDPNDTKWTLKYREKKRGLIELMPLSGVYVERKELKRCIRESNKDCRTLVRLLLTEVFRGDALGVCSWTGGKAKAFNSVEIERRPGLNEDARMALLTFVEEHAKKNDWRKANLEGIMSLTFGAHKEEIFKKKD
ncbi:unnamed protein product [Leptidea sinapis]|uniref:BEN domain-containing protein n=1 Tax=Leptidea sinapis TaxID=189913 RepID=A0A5E4PRE2_9NEOP|nr:unnamed protein product [Leptidea sinapis]